MGIISKSFTNKVDQEWDLPALVKSKTSHLIVLAIANEVDGACFTGTVVGDGEGYEVGYHTASWYTDEFELYTGSVTLNNEE